MDLPGREFRADGTERLLKFDSFVRLVDPDVEILSFHDVVKPARDRCDGLQTLDDRFDLNTPGPCCRRRRQSMRDHEGARRPERDAHLAPESQ